MKLCPTCKSTYPDDANFCPQETCATPTGPQRLQLLPSEPKARFELGSRIGGHSTGEVYQATDTQSGTEVAYKLVAGDVLPNATAVGRAERELKQLMRVQSQRIATIIDCGKGADDRLYVAMELCEGAPLDTILRSGPLGLEKAKAVVGQIGQALLEAQKAGIVHRDLAPKNVLCAPSGDIKVINFPFAKPINDKAAGVAAYLSPEQVQGKPVDQRSNTYSLAALFYHLVTGEPPFQGAPDAVLELHLSSPPLAPSQRRPEANLTSEVDRVILKALDKSSSRRHLTLRLFLSEVEALVPPPAPAAAPAAGGKDAGVGFAKTMLFAGGQAEVANLVAKAIAARGGAPAAAATPAPAPSKAPEPAPAPAQPRSTEARVAVAATVAAVPSPVHRATPAAGTGVPNGAGGTDDFSDKYARLTPPPVTPYPPGVMPGASASASAAVDPAATVPTPLASPAVPAGKGEVPKAGAGGGKSGAFRETLWFKKGDVEHMIAEARAKMGQGAPGKQGEPEVPVPGEEIKPIEDRYVDDGSVTAEDRKKFSLRSGGTAAAMPAAARGAVVPGESMSERDVIREVSGSRRGVIIGVATVVVLAVVVVAFMMMRGKPESAPPPPIPAAAAIPAPIPAPPPPAPAAAKPPEPAAKPADPPPRAVAKKADPPPDRKAGRHSKGAADRRKKH
jgi:hypothetical protein